jgi:hypothetical protein
MKMDMSRWALSNLIHRSSVKKKTECPLQAAAEMEMPGCFRSARLFDGSRQDEVLGARRSVLSAFEDGDKGF